MNEAPIYLFDGHCVLCSRGVHYVLRHETQPITRFVSIQSAEGRALANENDVDPENPHTFLYVKNGRALKLSDAVFALGKDIGGPAKYVLWLRFLPRFIRDFAYSLLADNRYRLFGRTDHCYVPNADDRHRFVLPDDT